MNFSAVCPAINEQLLNLSPENAPQVKVSQVGLLRWSMEQYNRSSVKMIPVNQGNGEVRTIQIMRQKRNTESQITLTNGECIDAPYIQDDNFAANVELGNRDWPAMNFKIEMNEVRKLCQGLESWVTVTVANKMDAMRRYLNSELITNVIANAGNYAGGTNSGTSPIALNLLEPIATGGITVGNYLGEATMLNTLSDASFVGTPAVVGNGDVRTYAKMQQIGCCNNGGIDMSQAGRFFYFEDEQLTTALGNNNFYAFEPGAIQFLPVPFYVGQYQWSEEGDIASTLNDPMIPGLQYDFKMYKPKGCDYYIGSILLRFVIDAPYNNGYQSGDILDGVNGIYQFNAAT